YQTTASHPAACVTAHAVTTKITSKALVQTTPERVRSPLKVLVKARERQVCTDAELAFRSIASIA
ncbi:hypothetical protein, partial [Pseudomonas viridiflava]|uniref:hypothetical protein n=1 Tax=Pseudomonas viridiflava TaxID=33069 RepID=UPI0019D273A9